MIAKFKNILSGLIIAIAAAGVYAVHRKARKQAKKKILESENIPTKSEPKKKLG